MSELAVLECENNEGGYDMLSYAEIDEKIQIGYSKIYENKDNVGGCDIWLEAWGGIKDVMSAEGLRDIIEMEKRYEWQQFIRNYVQDLEMGLMNAGLDDKQYIQKHIDYCHELIERSESQPSLQETIRMDMAESYFKLGNQQESDRLFGEWLEADPEWGWGYIGWSDCYADHLKEPNYERAEAILTDGLLHPGLRDRKYVLERIIEVCRNRGDATKARQYLQEMNRLGSVRVEKVGRNDPCPCGSGKKYKKCCGA